MGSDKSTLSSELLIGQIFDEKLRKKVEAMLKTEKFEHYSGSALLFNGKKPIIVGINEFVSTLGFATVESHANVEGDIQIDQIFLGSYRAFSFIAKAPIRGSVLFGKTTKCKEAVRGKLAVRVYQPLNGSLSIVDDSNSLGGVENMKINIAWPCTRDVRIEIGEKSPEVGFSLSIAGPLDSSYTVSRKIIVEEFMDQDTKVYRLIPRT